MDWIFASFFQDEDAVRESMVDLLELQPGSRVLETGCGTCRDSITTARRLGNGGHRFLQDLSPAMLTLGRLRVREALPSGTSPRTEFFVGNAAHLPFPDGSFDAAFHFGGLNMFSGQAPALDEMARVVKVGGKVAAGDEALGPWLRETTYGRILQNSNPLYRDQVPRERIPVSARDVAVRWIIGNAYYLIEFRVGEGERPLDLDMPILGHRGGTHRSRYYGAARV